MHKSEPTMINVLKVLIDHYENVGNISIIHLIQRKRNKNESYTYPDVESKRPKLVTNWIVIKYCFSELNAENNGAMTKILKEYKYDLLILSMQIVI